MIFLLAIPGAFFAPVIHEWVKAMVSTALGDDTPRSRGFLTWNPFKFFEPIGFILMMVFYMGWGRPVPTSSLHYKDRRKGTILTYTVPILANLLIGILVIMIVAVVRNPLLQWGIQQYLQDASWALTLARRSIDMAEIFAFCNISLALFNLLPVYPLAGNKLIQLFVSPETVARMNHFEKPMQIILILLLAIGILSMIVTPVAAAIIDSVNSFMRF